MSLRTAALLLSLGTISISQGFQPTAECPILGPVLPADSNISESKAFQKAAISFQPALEQLFESGALNRTGTSFAIDVFSAKTNTSIFSFSHSGEALDAARTAGVIDDGTIFRVGSVSKLYTVYAILAKTGGLQVLDDLVIKYIPELKPDGPVENNAIDWNEMTVGALAAQLGGTGGFTLDVTLCEVPGSNITCSIPDFLHEMRDRTKARAPVFETALYSDAGFGVLGRVLERLTNQTYNEAVKSVLGNALGFSSSTTIEPKGDDLNALNIDLALPEGSSWGFDNQVSAPSGGIYANAHDLRALGLSILHSQFISETHTRQWMKPHAHTATLLGSIGAPWEIYRLQIPITPESNLTRISDVYTKAGGQQNYGTVFGLSPDHELGWSINVGGTTSGSDRFTLQELVGSLFVPAAEFSAWEHAAANYAGTFTDPHDDSTNLTLTIDADQPGVGLQSIFVQGQDVRGALLDWTFSFLPLPAEFNLTTRMYPTGARFADAEGADVAVFNAVVQNDVQPRAPAGLAKTLFDVECSTFLTTGYLNTTDFEFGRVGGKVQSVRWNAGNVTMRRVE